MANIDWTRATKYFLLQDFIKGFALGMKYFFAPKATVNYPHEKGPLRFAPRRRSPLMPNRARTAAAAPRAMTST